MMVRSTKISSNQYPPHSTPHTLPPTPLLHLPQQVLGQRMVGELRGLFGLNHLRQEAQKILPDLLVLGWSVPKALNDSVIEGGEVIEDYPDAYPTPACLVLGFNTMGEPIHSVWSYDRIRQVAKLITVYRPDPNRWVNWRIRK